MTDVNGDVFGQLMGVEARLDPYPVYERFRQAGPIIDTGLGVFFVFSYDDCLALLRDRRALVDERNSIYPPAKTDPLPTLIKIDPPDHDRLRRLVQVAFTPRRVEALKLRAEELVSASLDRFSSADEIDLVEELAYPVPLTIIFEMLGIDRDAESTVREWSTWLARSIDPDVFRTPELDARIKAVEDEFLEHMTAVIAKRRRSPGDDLLSQLVVAEMDGDRLTERELLGLTLLLLVAGHETTVSLIGNGMNALLRNPDQFEQLYRGLGGANGEGRPMSGAAARTAIDELLRFDSPVQMTVRVAEVPIELSTATIPKGNLAVLLLGAANRDPNAFADPARLDVLTKRNNAHIAFGNGIHHCLGAALARAEGEVAISELVRRFPKMQLLGEPKLRPTFVLRGREELRVALGG